MKDLSRSTRTYLIATYLAGTAILIASLVNLQVQEPVLFAILCVLGATLHILKVEGATNRSHYTFSFLVFGFAILHLHSSLALLVILVSNVAEWIWNKPPWFIQLFNISCYLIVAQIAILVNTSINPLQSVSSWPAILGIGFAMASFTLLNHLIVGVVLWLARGENFKESGIFGLTPLLIDLAMLTVGASLALIWRFNPYALLIFLTPAYPLYMALKIPALERKTEIDQKTGLYNHQYFVSQFNNELQRANRYDRPLSVIIADLDLLRNINNTYGHLAGDEVLKGVATILKQTVREYDVVARFGGEEFAILMPETEIGKAIQRAEVMREAIQSARFVVPTSVEPIRATMSFGISQRDSFAESQDEILHHADTALYKSKLSGRNMAFAFVGDEFLGTSGEVQRQSEINVASDTRANFEVELEGEYSAANREYCQHAEEKADGGSQSPQDQAKQPSSDKDTGNARRTFITVRSYISIVAAVAVMAAATFTYFSSTNPSAYTSVDWTGFAIIALTIILTEWFSINLYVRNTALSTSAVPIIALIVLFGPLGTVAASAVFAATAAIKFRSPFNRLVFNFSNHVIAGILINAVIFLTRSVESNWPQLFTELVLALGAALILYVCTTVLISIGIGVDMRQSAREIWKAQYQWLGPYYVGMGCIAFALIFGYVKAGLPGILTMLIPMMLLRISHSQYVENTRATVNEIRQKNQQLERAALEINATNEGLLRTLSQMIDLRDPNASRHSLRVSQYAAELAKMMGLNEKQVQLVQQAALLHDIGMFGIPADILMKPGKLAPDEYRAIQAHAAIGGDLVKSSPALRPLANIIRHHHEAYDGNGYPDRLAASQISIESRILAVADAIEAMTSDRPYRKALKTRIIITELEKYAGSQFDPHVAGEAIKMLSATPSAQSASSKQSNSKNAAQLNINIQAS